MTILQLYAGQAMAGLMTQVNLAKLPADDAAELAYFQNLARVARMA